MKAAVYLVPGRSHEGHLSAMARGLREHSIAVSHFADDPDQEADFAVVWGWRLGKRLRSEFNGPILVMERGYIGDRFEWTSLGWDGLNGRARFAKVNNAARFERHFSNLLQPWRPEGGYALIVGQVSGDAALADVNVANWYRETAVGLYHAGWDVKFRRHPVEIERRLPESKVPPFAELVSGTLNEAIAGAGLVCTFNSNTGVDSILAGCPVHAADNGSMVFELSSRDFNPIRPAREKRLAQIAWCQWSIDEIRSGAAWDIVRQAM